MDNPLVVIAAPDHPLVKKRKIPLRALGDEAFLMREQGSGTRIAVERFLADKDLVLSSGIEMTSNEVIKQSVEAGLGLGIVSVHTIGLELQVGRLATLDVRFFPIIRQWYVVHREGKRLAAAAKAFKEFVLSTPHPGQRKSGKRG
jgi:DNA-binding transcriptional LysR family regulator